MNKSFVSILLFLAVVLGAFTHANPATPTQRYLAETSLEQIENHLKMYGWEDDFAAQLPFFAQIVQNEEKGNFFGYHGSTQKYRLFQDILRAAFEEVLGYEIPDDFHFLRVPGAASFDLERGKESFFALFGRKNAPETLDLLVNVFILMPLNHTFGCALKPEDFVADERELLRQIFIDYAAYLDAIESSWLHVGLGDELKALGSGPVVRYVAHGDESPQVLAHKREVAKKVNHLLRQQEALKVKAGVADAPAFAVDFPRLATTLRLALGPDHAAIEQQALEAWLKRNLDARQMVLNFWQQAQALEWTLEEYEQAEAFLMPYLDTRKEQQLRLVCMNVPLYGNYFRWDESSVAIFMADNSIESGDYYVKKELKDFFKELGIKPNLVDELFSAGYDILKADLGSLHGCLYQFYDVNATYPYAEADLAAYVSYDFGVPLRSVQTSDVVLGQREFKAKGVDLQLRLVMSNHTTLNPFGGFRIVRYDRVDPQTSRNLLAKLKMKLRKAPKNKAKVKAYKKKMDLLWNQTPANEKGFKGAINFL